MAPFTPFITERVWQDLFAATDVQSVHLTEWPTWANELIDDKLTAQVDLTRRIVELGRAARANSGVKTRQPLQRALVAASGWDSLPEGLQAQIREEVNVLQLDSLAQTAELVDVTVKANFKNLGARFGKETPNVANAITSADARELVSALKAGSATVSVSGKAVSISLEDVVITEAPREGWTVASEGGESLALDLALTPDLIQQGIARDVTRLIQDGRKSSGFDISDRISVTWQATNEDTKAAMDNYGQQIATEVLATSWQQGEVSQKTVVDEELGFTATLVKN